MPIPKIKILHIITHLPIGGAQDNTLLSVEKTDRGKFDLTLISAQEGDWIDRALKMNSTEIVFVNHLTRSIHPWYDLLALWAIYKNIKKNKYDVVHTHQAKAGILGRVAAWLAGVPVIIHTYHSFPFHDFMKPVARKIFITIEKMVGRITDKLISVSKLNLEKGVELKIAPREKFTTIYSGIDFSKFNIEVNTVNIRTQLGIPANHKIVGMVGRLSEQKAPQYLIQAIPKVIEKFPKTTFILVGDGELRKELETQLKGFALNGRVQILGYRNDIPELMHLMDIFILTSLWEGLGRAMTEAMYMGKAVICTDVEGVPELVENRKTGLLIPTKDPNAAAQSLIDLLSSSEKRTELGKNARDKVRTIFEIDTMITQLEKLYLDLMQQKVKAANA